MCALGTWTQSQRSPRVGLVPLKKGKSKRTTFCFVTNSKSHRRFKYVHKMSNNLSSCSGVSGFSKTALTAQKPVTQSDVCSESHGNQ